MRKWVRLFVKMREKWARLPCQVGEKISEIVLYLLVWGFLYVWRRFKHVAELGLANLIVRILEIVPSTCIFKFGRNFSLILIFRYHAKHSFFGSIWMWHRRESTRRSTFASLGNFKLAIDTRNIAARENCVIGVVDAGVEQSSCVEWRPFPLVAT